MLLTVLAVCSQLSQPLPSDAFALRDIKRGEEITRKDVAAGSPVNTTPPSRDSSSSISNGFIAKRLIKRGDRITATNIRTPDIKLDPANTKAIYQDDGILIEIAVTPIGTGSCGDTIYVRLPNRRRSRAVITGAHTVTLIRNTYP